MNLGIKSFATSALAFGAIALIAADPVAASVLKIASMTTDAIDSDNDNSLDTDGSLTSVTFDVGNDGDSNNDTTVSNILAPISATATGAANIRYPDPSDDGAAANTATATQNGAGTAAAYISDLNTSLAANPATFSVQFGALTPSQRLFIIERNDGDPLTLYLIDSAGTDLGFDLSLAKANFGDPIAQIEEDVSNGAHSEAPISGVGFMASDFKDGSGAAYNGINATGFATNDGGGLDPLIIAAENVVPEPATLSLLGISGLILLSRRRKA